MSENKITFPVKLASNNPQSFGIVDATEISGHRSVDTLSDLYSISDQILSILKDGSDSIGQEWFVVSEDCKYRLDSWENRKSVAGWTKLPKQELVNTKQSVSEKDQPSGYAGLDSNGKIPIEKTYGTTATVVDVATYESLPATGSNGVIYYVSSTGSQYKWSGSAYIDISDGEDNAKKNETSIFDCSNGTSTKYYSSLSDAINVVPPAYRTSNRIISYLSTESSTTSAVNYQYHGVDSTTWTDLTKWERIPNQADLVDLRSDLRKIINAAFSFSVNVNTGMYLDDNGMERSGSSYYETSDYIPVYEGQVLNYEGRRSGGGVVVYGYTDMSSNKTTDVLSVTDVSQNINFTIPSGVNYIRAFSGYSGVHLVISQVTKPLKDRIDTLDYSVSIIQGLLSNNYLFAGVANTATNPGTPTSNVFWIGWATGIYTHFNNYDAKTPLTLFYWYDNSTWVGEPIGRSMVYDNTPFAAVGVEPVHPSMSAIKDINVYAKDETAAKKTYSVRYLWKEYGANHSYCIGIEANGSQFKSWAVNNYTPVNDIETIYIVNNGTIVEVVIDWSLVESNVLIDASIYQIKKEKVHLVKDDGIIFNADTYSAQLNLKNAIINAYVIPKDIYDLSSVYFIKYIWKNYGGNNSTFIQVYKTDINAVSSQVGEKTFTSPTGIEKIELGNVVILLNWDLIPDGIWSQDTGAVISARYEIPIDESNDGYSVKDTIMNRFVVDKSGLIANSYSSISAACAAVKDSSHQNQYEIVVNPGIYNEQNIIIPPYTHIHGAHYNSVLVTSLGMGNTLPVFEQQNASSKLSNMTIESHTGYCIHVDVGLNKKTVYNENIHFKKYRYNGGNGAIIGGGTFQMGAMFEFNGCVFEGCDGIAYPAESAFHTQGWVQLDNTRLIYRNCTFINSYINIGSVGGYGKNLLEVTNCRFELSRIGLKYWLSLDGKTKNGLPQYHFANKLEWDVIGGNNINLCPNFIGAGDAVCIESTTATSGQKLTVSGEIADALLGVPQYHIGGNTLKAKAIGIYLVKDEQVGSTDIYQMWKRLGDCSTTNKTLSVSINGGTAQVVTLAEDYLTSKKSETEIMAQINAQLSGVEIKKHVLNNYFDHIHLTEIAEVRCTDNNDVLQYCVVDANGKRLTQNATSGYYGIALADAANDEYIKVWTGKSIYLGITDGSYAVGSDGKLTASNSNVIGNVVNGIFTFAS